jgi:hypothetical protein
MNFSFNFWCCLIEVSLASILRMTPRRSKRRASVKQISNSASEAHVKVRSKKKIEVSLASNLRITARRSKRRASVKQISNSASEGHVDVTSQKKIFQMVIFLIISSRMWFVRNEHRLTKLCYKK